MRMLSKAFVSAAETAAADTKALDNILIYSSFQRALRLYYDTDSKTVKDIYNGLRTSFLALFPPNEQSRSTDTQDCQAGRFGHSCRAATQADRWAACT